MGGGTTSSTTPGGPKQLALAEALRRAPDVERTIQRGRGRSLHITGWGEPPSTLGFVASYELDRPQDLPTRFGMEKVLYDGPEGHDEIELDKHGLPVRVPLDAPTGWSDARFVDVWVATTGPDAPAVHFVRPGHTYPCSEMPTRTGAGAGVAARPALAALLRA